MGLTEVVSLTPDSLTHAYPELGRATERQNSPYHRLEIFSRLPFLLPDADDLAINASVQAKDDSTVTVSCGDKVQLTLTFAEESRLASLTWHRLEDETVTFSADGTIELADGTTLKLIAGKPSPPAQTADLFTLPVPALGSSAEPVHHLAGHRFDDPTTI